MGAVMTRLIARLRCALNLHDDVLRWRRGKPIVACAHCDRESDGWF
jgi:hypothetical protein